MPDKPRLPPTPAEWEALKASHTELLAACEATLLFHKGGQWTIGDSDAWVKLTSNVAVTTKALCDFARTAIANTKKVESQDAR